MAVIAAFMQCKLQLYSSSVEPSHALRASVCLPTGPLPEKAALDVDLWLFK